MSSYFIAGIPIKYKELGKLRHLRFMDDPAKRETELTHEDNEKMLYR